MNGNQQTRSAFLVAITLSVCTSSTVLMLAEGSFLPVGLTPIFAIAAVLWNDRSQRLVLPTIAANILGVTAVVASGLELYFGNEEARILAGAHLIVYLTWVALFMQKKDRQYWWLVALSVLQLAISCVLTRSSSLGLALIGMLFLLIWTLALFTLHRLQLRAATPVTFRQDTPGAAGRQTLVISHGIQTDSRMQWINARFRLMILGMCVASLIMSGITFAVFPRVFVGAPGFLARSHLTDSGLIQRTGFRDKVKLGDFGTILESNERVLQIATFDQASSEPVSIDQFAQAMEMDELLLRGSTMGTYASGEWSRSQQEGQTLIETRSRRFRWATTTDRCFRVEITQDAPIGRFAFAPAPVISARLMNSTGRLLKGSRSETLIFDVSHNRSWQQGTSPNFNRQPIVFQVFCVSPDRHRRRNPPVDLPSGLLAWLYPNAQSDEAEKAADKFARTSAITKNIETVVPGVCQLARQICYENGYRVSPTECARRINSLLRDSGQYRYSLTMTSMDDSLDPVDDFLLNHRTGHCQYFASACALMLQAADIPARIINGFKGTEVNVVSGETEVRQKHAHVWVEYRHNGQWHSLDPTPASRDELVENSEDPGVLSDLQTTVSDLLDAGMRNVTPERQRAAIKPVLAAATESINRFRELGLMGSIKALYAAVMSDPSRWFSWQALVGTMACLVPLTLLLRNRPLRWVNSFSQWLRNRRNPQRRNAQHIVRFYEHFCHVCAQAGLDFPVSHTARENAALARDQLLQRSTPDLQVIPGRIADAFNAVRYGDCLLTEEQTNQLGHDMMLLKAEIERDGEDGA